MTTPSGPTPSRVPLWGAIVGALLVVAGVVIYFTTPWEASFGWFAYAPLSQATFGPSFGFGHPQATIGAITSVIGLVILAIALGWHLGHRSARRHSP